MRLYLVVRKSDPWRLVLLMLEEGLVSVVGFRRVMGCSAVVFVELVSGTLI